MNIRAVIVTKRNYNPWDNHTKRLSERAFDLIFTVSTFAAIRCRRYRVFAI
jgi:hypothetical protein